MANGRPSLQHVPEMANASTASQKLPVKCWLQPLGEKCQRLPWRGGKRDQFLSPHGLEISCSYRTASVHVVPPLFMSYRLCSCRTASVHVVPPLFISYCLCSCRTASVHVEQPLFMSYRLCSCRTASVRPERGVEITSRGGCGVRILC